MRRLHFRALALALVLLFLCACTPRESAEPIAADVTWDTLVFDHSMELLYADQFSVDYYQGGYLVVTIADTDVFLVVPEGAEVPSGVPGQVTVLQQPLDRIYLVATSAMDLFRELDAIGSIRLSGLDASGWYIEEAKQALADGQMLYAGKYLSVSYTHLFNGGHFLKPTHWEGPMRHLINITDLSTAEIDELIAVAEDIIADPEKYQSACRHKKLATLFFEPSTRTRLSLSLIHI